MHQHTQTMPEHPLRLFTRLQQASYLEQYV